MPTVETYRKQSKLLLRWHRAGNFSIGERVRHLERYRSLTDLQVLSLKFTLALAQEIVAVESGYGNWAELKTAAADAPKTLRASSGPPVVKNAIPVLFVRDVKASANFFHEKLRFKIDFLRGIPPFYGAVSRQGACLHLRHVEQPFFAQAAAQERGLICAFIEVANGQALFEEFKARNVDFAQKPTKQAWGGTDFHLKDPDGNVISFVTYK